jgi:hypothetical protein
MIGHGSHSGGPLGMMIAVHLRGVPHLLQTRRQRTPRMIRDHAKSASHDLADFVIAVGRIPDPLHIGRRRAPTAVGCQRILLHPLEALLGIDHHLRVGSGRTEKQEGNAHRSREICPARGEPRSEPCLGATGDPGRRGQIMIDQHPGPFLKTPGFITERRTMDLVRIVVKHEIPFNAWIPVRSSGETERHAVSGRFPGHRRR